MTNINEKITAFAGDMLEEAHVSIRNKIWDKLPDESKAKITPENMGDINTCLKMVDSNELKAIVSEVIKEVVRVKISKNASNMVNNAELTNKGVA